MLHRLPRAALSAIVLSAAVLAAPQAPAPPPLAAADAAMQAGRYAEAARIYDDWLAAHPDSREVLFALGVCRIQLGQPVEAVSALRRYLHLAPDSASGYAAFGVALLDAASPADARHALEKAVALNPAQANAVEALARLHLVEDRADAAVALLRAFSDRDAGSARRPELRLLFAESLIRAGDAAAAASMLEAQLAAEPRSPPPVYALAAWARIRSGDPVRAAGICEQGMRIHPDSEIEGVYLSLPGPLLAERTKLRLERLASSPDIGELIALGRVLTDVDPARKTRAAEIARSLLAQAVAMAPANPSAHYNHGRALFRTDADAAMAAWHKALALDPPDELRLQILTQLAQARDLRSDAAGAAEAFRSALDINRRLPRRAPEPAIEYVRFLQRQGRGAEAEALVDEIVGWNPWAPEARIERARMLADKGNWQDVITEGEFVLRAAADNRELLRVAHLLLARAYYRLDQPAKAQGHREWLESQ